MLPRINKVKGVHPGSLLKRELKKRGIRSSELAAAIDEHKQTISAILNERRGINPKLSIKLGEEFNVAEDYFMILQSAYDVKMEYELIEKPKPNIENFRRALFWDTDLNKIDWDRNSKAVIKRVMERGNENEINEIISYYGKKRLQRAVKSIDKNRLPSFDRNVEEYLMNPA
ncbi:MAG: addiction module antidote protein, HigA family [Flavobacteriales bacterium]|nr:addiction module antidote protein, HigA family [Flavobacteriales bacterium]|tara:strand:+ start:750 stop:1265 length:516 start_codon:yes stop_codon:yes gene_type:complete